MASGSSPNIWYWSWRYSNRYGWSLYFTCLDQAYFFTLLGILTSCYCLLWCHEDFQNCSCKLCSSNLFAFRGRFHYLTFVKSSSFSTFSGKFPRWYLHYTLVELCEVLCTVVHQYLCPKPNIMVLLYHQKLPMLALMPGLKKRVVLESQTFLHQRITRYSSKNISINIIFNLTFKLSLIFHSQLSAWSNRM